MEAVISNNTLEKCKKLSHTLGEIPCCCGEKLLAA